MAVKTKKSPIPSILVNAEFIKRLGNIIEKKAREQQALYEATRDKTPEEDRWKIREPNTRRRYSFETNDGDITYESSDEILLTNLLPSGIKEFSAYVSSGDKSAVDISLSISSPWGMFGIVSPSTYTLSSSNEAELLLVDKELKELFSAFRTGYHSVLFYFNNLLPLSLTAMASAVLLAHAFYPTLSDFPQSVASILIYVVGLSFYSTIMEWLKWIYPFYEFDLSPTENFRKSFRVTIWVIFLGILSGFVLLFVHI